MSIVQDLSLKNWQIKQKYQNFLKLGYHLSIKAPKVQPNDY